MGPEKALTLGPHEGEDLVDLLLRLLEVSAGPLRQAQLICVMGFDDPRTNHFLAEEFLRSRDTASVLHLGKRLSLTQGPEFFRPLLWEKQGAQALAAARFLCEEAELTQRERLRVSLLLDQDYAPPPLDEDTLNCWLEELSGPHRLRVRRLLEEQPEQLSLLWSRYGELAQAEQAWFVAMEARLAPSELRLRLPDLLKDPTVTPELVEQSLQLGVELPQTLLKSPHDSVRAHAVAAGLADERLEDFLHSDASILEARAATFRSPLERQLELLADHRWEIRAAATACLAATSKEELPIDKIRTRALSTIQGEKIAAVEVLRRLGDTDWLQDHLS